MSNTIVAYIENVNAAIAAGFTTLRLYRDTEPELITTASTLVAEATLVADQEEYELTDASGSAELWYAHILYDGTNYSSFSRRYRSGDTSLSLLRLEAAKLANAGYASTCTAAGTTTQLTDSRLIDSASGDDFMQGAWIWRPNAVDSSDRVRRVAQNGYASGNLSVDRAWLNAPEVNEVYHLYSLAPPIDQPSISYSWLRAVNDGLAECRFIDTLNLGPGTAAGKTDFSLAAHLGYVNPERDLRRVFCRRTIDETNNVFEDIDWKRNGRDWERVIESDSYAIRLMPRPAVDLDVMVEVRRAGEALYANDDVTNCPFQQAIHAAAWKMYEHLAANGRAEFQSQAAAAFQRFERERRRVVGSGVVIV